MSSPASAPHPRKAAVSEQHHSYHIEALARGLAVLDAFSPQHPELTLREVSEAAGVTQPSALRIGFTLIEAGYLVRNTVTKGYRLGPRVVAVGLATLASMTLPEIAEPFLVDLRDRTQETIKLAIPADTEVVVVARYPSRRHPPGNQYIGTHMPIHTASLGRAVMAWLPDTTVVSLLDRVDTTKLTAKTLSKAQVRRELKATRERGYSINDQGVTSEHRAVAAPLIDPSGAAVAAINISVSAQRISVPELEKQLAPLVVETAARISATLPPQVQGAGWMASS